MYVVSMKVNTSTQKILHQDPGEDGMGGLQSMHRYNVHITWEKQGKDGSMPSGAGACLLATWKNNSLLTNCQIISVYRSSFRN